MKDRRIFYTDGACGGRGKNRVGGWCYVELVPMNNGGYQTDICTGSKGGTTNNEMELTAAYMAIVSAYKRGIKKIALYTDSMYIVNTIGRDWLSTWKEDGWKTSQGKDVKNLGIWEKVYKLIHEKGMDIRMVWVKGHGDDPLNCLADQKAVEAYGGLVDEAI